MGSLTQIEVLLPEIRAYAKALCDRPENAEELVQDAIERALRAEERPSALSEFRPWMFRVIRNLRYDELRKRRVRREYISKEKRLYGQGYWAQDHSRDILLRLAFERMPSEKREILFLIDVIGLRYAEAAEIMGVAAGTVMSRLSRAREALREEIGIRSDDTSKRES